MRKRILCIFMVVVFAILTGCTQNVTDKNISIAYGDKTLSGTYTGVLESGKAVGEGVFSATTDDGGEFVYEGTFSDGEMTGAGKLQTTAMTIQFPDTERTGSYAGDIVNFVPEGYGEFRATNSEGFAYTISGEWKNGRQHGQSERVFDDSSIAGEKGTYVDGVYTPTYMELLSFFGEYGSAPFEISQETLDFYNENSSLFPAQSVAELEGVLNAETKYKHLDKNITGYYKQIVKLEQCYVTQATELDDGRTRETNMTILLVRDGMDYFYVYYPGKCNVYEGDKITLYGLPIAMSSFDNVSGGTTLTCVLLGSFIEN